MDPFTALSIACNVVDLAGVAINGGMTVKEIYSSPDGFKKQQGIVQKSTDEMNKIAERLRQDQTKLAEFTKDEELQRLQVEVKILAVCIEVNGQVYP